MSSRQLRKLQKQKELQDLRAQNAADDDAESSEDNQPMLKSRANAFTGFAALGDHDNPDRDGDDNDEDEKADDPVEASDKNPVAEPDHTDTPKNSSKKNKKKKKKAKKREPVLKPAPPVAQDGMDEIERALRELKSPGGVPITSDPTSKPSPGGSYYRICELLKVSSRHLKVLNEMRTLFGREAIVAAQTEEDQEQTQARARRQRQPLEQQVDLETYLKAQPGKSLPEVTLRRNPFLTGKETWPRASTEGLTMLRVSERQDHPGVIEFRFAHDEAYNRLESRFFRIVQMYDPMQIVYFLHSHPYHISSLIQSSRVAKQDQNSALSADLCERALFTFGRVSVSLFRQKIEEGKARLDFRRPENRQFWLAGYHYLKNLMMKGTYRTALEWCKLLFSMDWDDPYGIINFIHPLAVRAHESKWFIDFCDALMPDLYPTARDYIRQTLVLARLQQNDVAGAKALLLEGMGRLPWLYVRLFQSLNFDIPKAIWGLQPRNQDEELHTEVYVHQTKGLWENTQARSLLKEAGKEARRPDVKTFPFPPTAQANLARCVYLLEVPSLMGLVPRELVSAPVNWEFDPFPPPCEDNLFSHESQKLPWSPESIDGWLGAGGPNEGLDLRRILEEAQADDLQGIIDEADRNDREGLLEDDGTPSRGDSHGLGAIFQAFMDLLDPRGASTHHSDLDGFDLDGIPGAWHDDDDDNISDELPPLVPMDGADDNNSSGELPPLVPMEGANDETGDETTPIPPSNRGTEGRDGTDDGEANLR
ncbi:DUF654-domain-containing protein [Durotheca rogersii]|uniref:DUF654-domain-containing protein n=1 Tax=Durotheca rogersii TaxID=419775 RepID=UPI0022205CA1|nr:DUF654-domain-containing protein [Durotheca rogersii]KAI5864354.1 DUF654-domain-containing protein [Durotheca rogersii]